jgi:hypothetical protein
MLEEPVNTPAAGIIALLTWSGMRSGPIGLLRSIRAAASTTLHDGRSSFLKNLG